MDRRGREHEQCIAHDILGILLPCFPLRASPPWKRWLRTGISLQSRMTLELTRMMLDPFTF